jgi:myo-inositol-1(or 4)-monophosphatase
LDRAHLVAQTLAFADRNQYPHLPMKPTEQRRALRVAIQAARSAGAIMSRNFFAPKKVLVSLQHDIKLELDVRCQKRIESVLRRAFPDMPILGEEGVLGAAGSDYRWVVDPIDGTVNFTYGIPHACVSIALQQKRPPLTEDRPVSKRAAAAAARGQETWVAAYDNLVGVVHDPFCRETFTAVRGQAARLNGRRIAVSRRDHLEEAIVSVGFAKTRASLERMLPALKRLTHRVRKVRIMGSAALSLVYVASGRMDAYLERGLRLWDIAAGGLILECAGGDFHHWPLAGRQEAYGLLASNGHLRRPLGRLVW